MLIEDKRKKQENQNANIGDMIITNSGHYLLLDNRMIDFTYSIAIYDIFSNQIKTNTRQKVFCIGGTLIDEEIIDIVPSENFKIVIEDKYGDK